MLAGIILLKQCRVEQQMMGEFFEEDKDEDKDGGEVGQ